MPRLLLFVCLYLSASSLLAQPSVDVLLAQLAAATADSERLPLLIELAEIEASTQPLVALAHGREALLLAQLQNDSANVAHASLYLGLAMGLPSIALMWLISLRSPERKWVNWIVSWGKPVTLLTVASQFSQRLYHVYLEHGAFSWVNGMTLVVLLWFGIYVLQSRSVRDSLKTPALA